MIREIEPQQSQPQGLLGKLLETGKRIHAQERGDGPKVYRVHEPEVACITKGKAGKKYEFGNKVSLAATIRGGWLLGALSLLGNPYDGHTLHAQLTQVRRLVITHAVKEGPMDMG